MVLQRYRAKQELGKGSFGTVYLTEGRRDKKAYVVKVVDNLRENNLKVQEIRVMMHLRHRNIVEMCDFYTSNNQLCIVMGYADGGDLRNEVIKARNARTNISEELISVWLIQVCQALDYAHQEQIIHRDIKPSNIFLMADGKTVKVGDFGISKVLDSASGSNQMTAAEAEGGRVGTKRYMAPEILNRSDYSNKADVWSLGCVLFELLTLNHPTYESDGHIWLEWIPSMYSSNIRDICQQCLAENAMLRPSPKELIVKFAAPFLNAPLVQQEFYSAMQWYDAKLMESHAALEQQANLLSQLFPNYHVPVPTSFAKTLDGSGSSPILQSDRPPVTDETARGESVVLNRNPKLYASQNSAPHALLKVADPTMDVHKSQPGMHKEKSVPSLRASMSSIEHFNIPEYKEDEDKGQMKQATDMNSLMTPTPSLLASAAEKAHDPARPGPPPLASLQGYAENNPAAAPAFQQQATRTRNQPIGSNASGANQNAESGAIGGIQGTTGRVPDGDHYASRQRGLIGSVDPQQPPSQVGSAGTQQPPQRLIMVPGQSAPLPASYPMPAPGAVGQAYPSGLYQNTQLQHQQSDLHASLSAGLPGMPSVSQSNEPNASSGLTSGSYSSPTGVYSSASRGHHMQQSGSQQQPMHLYSSQGLQGASQKGLQSHFTAPSASGFVDIRHSAPSLPSFFSAGMQLNHHHQPPLPQSQPMQQSVSNLRSSYDSARLSQALTCQPQYFRDSSQNQDIQGTRASHDSASLNHIRQHSEDGDASKVLQELERVRSGIQATLAAVGTGTVSSASLTNLRLQPPQPPQPPNQPPNQLLAEL